MADNTERVIEIVAEQLGVDKEKVKTETSFVGDLGADSVSYTHLRAHETLRYLVCRLLLEKKKK